MDENAHEVTARRARSIPLTATEFNLLRFFLLNPRHVLSKAQILDHVWHYDFGGDANVVETYVSYLRKKLEVAGRPSSTPCAASATACDCPRTDVRRCLAEARSAIERLRSRPQLLKRRTD